MNTNRLQAIRRDRGLSQAELSRLSGVALTAVQKYERGAMDINGAKLLTLLRLCGVLQCGLRDILDDPQTLQALQTYEKARDK